MPRRKLNAFERTEAELVFVNSIRYERVRVVENDWFALAIAKLGSRIAGEQPPKTNAVGLRNTIRFSRLLNTMESANASSRLVDTAWLIHELTHVWQYQHFGISYLTEAASARITKGSKASIYSSKGALPDRGEELKEMWARGIRLRDFNREQQGDIARDYYSTLKKGHDTSGWLPYIEEIRSTQ